MQGEDSGDAAGQGTGAEGSAPGSSDTSMTSAGVDDDFGAFQTGRGVAARYTRLLYSLRWGTIVTAVVLLAVGAAYGPPLLHNTSQELLPPAGSASDLAQKAMSKAFPGQQDAAAVVVLLQMDRNASGHGMGHGLLSPAVRSFSLQLNASVWQYNGTAAPTSFEGWWVAQEMGLPPLARDLFLSGDGSRAGDATYLVAIADAETASREAIDFANFVRTSVGNLWPPPGSHPADLPKLNTSIVGLPAIVDALSASAERDLALVDGVALPLSAAVLGYILRGARLLLLPAACIAVSALTSFAVMNAVALNTSVVSFAPSLMSSVLVALSIDYALFLCSRFRSELLRGLEPRDAVVKSLATAGHTVLLSGSTLVFCFIGLLALPVRALQMPGVACGVAVTCTVTANLTLGPTLLLTFPRFFSRCIMPWSQVCRCCSRQSAQKQGAEGSAVSEASALLRAKSWQDEYAGTCWLALGKLVLRPWIGMGLVILIAGVSVPFALEATKTVKSDSFALDLPRGSDIEEAYNAFAGAFGLGMLYPYRLLVQPRNSGPQPILNGTFFAQSQEMIYRMAAEVDGLSVTEVQGLTSAFGLNSSWPLIASCLHMPVGEEAVVDTSESLCQILNASVSQFVSSDHQSTYFVLLPNVDPVGLSGLPFLQKIRAVVEKEEHRLGYTMYLQGIAPVSWDSVDAVYSHFPVMALTTVGIVVVLVGWAFRSAVVSVRCVASIALSLCFVYGMAQLTYVDGALTWTSIHGFGKTGALMWISPAMSLVICAGICLDYDIMIGLRIMELRKDGMPTRQAVLRGLCDTGRVVTAAGVVMAVSFSGLLASNMPVVNQLGFYLVGAVLFDTFIVRSVLVPSLMAVLGEWNWWPARLPDIRTADVAKQEGTARAV